MPAQTTHPQHIRRSWPGSAFTLFSLIVGLILLAGCGEGPLVRQESFVFGTRVEVVTQGVPEKKAQAALSEVLHEFDRLHRTYHAWQASPLMTLNAALARSETAEVSPEMIELIAESRHFAELSDGLFNPAIGGLIQLWGFHSDTFVPALPDQTKVERLVAAHPTMLDIEVSGTKVSSRNPAARLDFGGIAKGYALDQAALILRKHGVHNALINIGGNILALGAKGKTPWTVGIQHPRKSGAIATLALYDGEAIGTSGDYQRFFEIGGQRYSHLIDPNTGKPATHTQAVTVLITPREHAGLLSDVGSKPIFLGATRWQDMAHRCGIDHVLRIDASGKTSVTQAMRARLRWQQGQDADEVVQ